jgi:type IX secretion system PorP/SprF family membrane protein
MKVRILLFTILFSLFLVKISAQDIHYSQFYNAPLTISPALTGVFNGDQRVSVSLRDQWRSVPVPWFTATVGYDQKVYFKDSDKSFLGVGGFINYDRQGDSHLTLTNLNLTASYNYLLNKNNVLTVGGLVGFATRGFDTQELTWDRQWNGIEFVEGAGSGENFNMERVAILETSLGLNYRWQANSRTKVDVGVGAWHLAAPEVNYIDRPNSTAVAHLPRRYSAYVIGGLALTERLDLQLDGMAQFQNAYTEYLVGGYLNYALSKQRGKTVDLRVGAGYRTSQSFYPKLAVRFNQAFVAFSYDIDLSDFSQHTSGRGGPELHFQYTITHVKPMGLFKVCPIF